MHTYGEDSFIFANIGVPGRTGHDYPNRFIGDNLVWRGRTGSRLSHPSVRQLLDPSHRVFIFFRTEGRDKFTFSGLGRATDPVDIVPVQITWIFDGDVENHPERPPEEVPNPQRFREGTTRRVSVNVYERDPAARRACLDHHGLACRICGFDFLERYGELGRGYIHVHHLFPLASIGAEYDVDPVAHLLPVCSNCHAMIHRREPPLAPDEVRAVLSGGKVVA